MRGYSIPGKIPSFVMVSLWQIPQAWTLMRTDPAPGSGMSRSTISNGPLGRGTWTARIFAMLPPVILLCDAVLDDWSHENRAARRQCAVTRQCPVILACPAQPLRYTR